MSLKNTLVKLLPYLSGNNELMFHKTLMKVTNGAPFTNMV